jgi:hypothetical protein
MAEQDYVILNFNDERWLHVKLKSIISPVFENDCVIYIYICRLCELKIETGNRNVST